MEIYITKCTYPECTLCVDNCPMNNIDFSEIPPIFHNYCENCGLCWSLCPEDAVNVLNMIQLHLRQTWWDRVQKRARMEAPAGGAGQAPIAMGEPSTPKYLIPHEELYAERLIMFIPHVPCLVINKEDWPYEMDK